MLTFGRNGLVPFTGIFTLPDQILNLFVLAIAPWFAIVGFAQIVSGRYLLRLLPTIVVSLWVLLAVLAAPWDLWPSGSRHQHRSVADVRVAGWRSDLRCLRHIMLLLSALFAVLTLIYGQYALEMIRTGWLKRQLGGELSAANLVAFPRALYTLAFTCLVTLLIDKKKWLLVVAVGLMIMPLAIAFATAGRGLVAFAAAILAFVLALGRSLPFSLAKLLWACCPSSATWSLRRSSRF